MRIAVDARLALRKRRGMGRVLLNLLSALAEIDKTNHYFLYLEKADKHNILPASDNFTKRVIPIRNYPLWEQVILPIACKMDKIDVLHCPANTGPVIMPRAVRLVVTLHDAIFLKSLSEVPLSSSIYQNLGRAYRYLCARLLRNRIDYFMTDSQWSSQDIQQLLNVTSERIVVIPCSIDDYFSQKTKEDCTAILSQLGIDSRFIFHLGGIAPNKNTIGAIEAYRLLIQDEIHRELSLVIGGVRPDSNNQITQFVIGKGLKGKVQFLNYVTDEELKCLYSKAELFLFPSLYEGFGLPPLEAMACGSPVLASNTTSLPEAIEDAGILVNPHKTNEIVGAMKKILQDKGLREHLISRGLERAKSFTWRHTAERVLAVYKGELDT
jgi:glycosyltransferase involved in cell wall biosynthesis